MASKNMYCGDSNDTARRIKKLYYGDENGIARKIKKVYYGDENGTARQVYGQSLPPILLYKDGIANEEFFDVNGEVTKTEITGTQSADTQYIIGEDYLMLQARTQHEWSTVKLNVDFNAIQLPLGYDKVRIKYTLFTDQSRYYTATQLWVNSNAESSRTIAGLFAGGQYTPTSNPRQIGDGNQVLSPFSYSETREVVFSANNYDRIMLSCYVQNRGCFTQWEIHEIEIL